MAPLDPPLTSAVSQVRSGQVRSGGYGGREMATSLNIGRPSMRLGAHPGFSRCRPACVFLRNAPAVSCEVNNWKGTSSSNYLPLLSPRRLRLQLQLVDTLETDWLCTADRHDLPVAVAVKVQVGFILPSHALHSVQL